MPYDASCHLWPDPTEGFFRERRLRPLRQAGPHCVSTALSILTGATPEAFQGVVNTQDPISWSDKIREWGMQFAYCPTDVRKLGFYLPELVALDDLFTLSFYTSLDSNVILRNPDARGWTSASHIVVLHRDRIFDPATGLVTKAREHACRGYYTKRIFRVVPAGHPRSL